jgi:steroid delta-isomerase-like uncharacterized protein
MTTRGDRLSRDAATAFVRRLADAVNAHDADRLADTYAEDAVVVSPAFSTLVGREAIRASWERIFSTFPDWAIEVHDVLVDGERIAAYGVNSGIDRKGWFGLPPTGGLVRYRAVLFLTLAGGRIVREERLYEMTAVLEGLEKARLDRELRTAAEVQAALLPRGVRVGGHYEAVGGSTACRTIGGDFFELADLPSGDLGVALGDVAGKGPAAALLAAMLQGMLAVEARAGNEPAATLSRVNRALLDRRVGRFATLVYGVLAPDGGFAYSSAGHNPPLVVSPSGVRRLTAGGLLLGAFPDAAFEQEMVRLGAGDAVVLFSDGVTEARNAHDEEFGEERLVACVAAHAGDSAPDLAAAVLDGVREFSGDAPPADDVTVAVILYRPRDASSPVPPPPSVG